MSQIGNSESDIYNCSWMKLENGVKLNWKKWVKLNSQKLSQVKNCESNQESWVELNMQNWVEFENVNKIALEVRELIEELMKMAVWRFHANGAQSDCFHRKREGVYVAVEQN